MRCFENSEQTEGLPLQRTQLAEQRGDLGKRIRHNLAEILHLGLVFLQ